MMIRQWTEQNFQSLCDRLADADPDLKHIIQKHGYPPMWSRPNTFESLVHIILEQQVSLASALAALRQLQLRLQQVTPENFLKLTDEELKACYFSRQKISYARSLAHAIQSGNLDLQALEQWTDEAVRAKLILLKGIGHWTIDVYCIFVLHRTDVFPIGDLAALGALKKVKRLRADISKEELLQVVATWQPYRTLATILLWHFYLSAPSEFRIRK